MKRARFRIENDSPGSLVIRDLGPWEYCLSVTNDAEAVVEDLVKTGRLKTGQKLLYYDSTGALDELVVQDGKFAGFNLGGH